MQLNIRDEGTMEIARSFSFKKNLGNYESADFFCSAKKECKPEDADKTSQALYDFCRKQVLKDIAAFLPKAEPPATDPNHTDL
ncbi:MAG TPA: hypothetical protein VE974_06200 [Thermoanaerobaculia bacterium]|nr:hypothetical protein [Thermoanaerobaculia bacterium]